MKPCYEIFLNGSSVITLNALYGNFLQLFNNFEMRMILGTGTALQPFDSQINSVFFDEQSRFSVKIEQGVKTVWECSFPVHRGPEVTIRAIRLGYLDGEVFEDVSESILAVPVTIYDGDLITVRYSLESSLNNTSIANIELVPLQNASNFEFYYLSGPLPDILDGQIYDVLDYPHEVSSAFTQSSSNTGSFEQKEILVNGPQTISATHGLFSTGYGGLYFTFSSPIEINQTISFAYSVGGQS